MVELFLVNYNVKGEGDDIGWVCHTSTHSLAIASKLANELRDMHYVVNVQSVLIDENGKVSV